MAAMNDWIMEEFPRPVLVVDRGFRIVCANRSMRALCGEVEGRRCHEIFHGGAEPCILPAGDCPVRSVLATGMVVNTSHPHRITDKESGISEITAFALRRGGKGDLMVGMVLFGQWTGGSSLQKSERAERLERLAVMGSMLGQMTHVMNSALFVADNYLQALLRFAGDVPFPDAAAGMIRGASTAVRTASDLTRTLLDFTRGKHGGGQSTMADVVEEILRLFRTVFVENRIEVVTDLRPGGPVLPRIDLLQIFIGLIRNAVDAMPDGGALEISCRRGDMLIRDSGPGIGKDVIERARRYGPGAGGIGLWMALRAVERLGGRIDIKTGEGLGTSIIITFPDSGSGFAGIDEEGVAREV